MGIEALDALLPERGVRDGTLIEWISGGPGSGALTLAIAAALGRSAVSRTGATQKTLPRIHVQKKTDRLTPPHPNPLSPQRLFDLQGERGSEFHTLPRVERAPERQKASRPLVVVDGLGTFYPPALGRVAELCVVVRPRTAAEALWAMEQVLRSGAAGGMVAPVERLSDRAGRRLQLAAEQGGGLGMLIRPARDARAPCWGEVRFCVEPVSTAGMRRFRVTLARCRGGPAGGSVDLELDDETGLVRVAAQLAAAAPLCREA